MLKIYILATQICKILFASSIMVLCYEHKGGGEVNFHYEAK